MGKNGKPEPFPATRHDRLKGKLTTDQWNLIVFQEPYPEGNDVLWGLNAIANAAKHGVGLVEVAAKLTPDLHSGKFKPYLSPASSNRQYPGEIRILGNVPSNATGKHRVLQGISIEGKIEFRKVLSVVFADIAPVAGIEALVVLNLQVRLVKQIVDLFARTS
jgi:hypothetical protein